MKTSHLVILLLLLSSLLAPRLNAGQHIGIVKSANGEVQLIANGTTQTATINMKVPDGSLLKTGATGKMGVIFDDDTLLSLGPNSEIAIDEVLFHPAENRLSFVARMLKGTFAFVSGQIAKLAPEKVQLNTPEATLGVRGTTFVVAVD